MDEHSAPLNGKRTASATRLANQFHRSKNLLLAYWWIVLSCTALSVGIQLLMLRRAPNTFISTGRMIVNVKLSIPSANIYSEELNNFFGTQVELMQSGSVVNRVKLRLQSTSPELRPSPVDIKVTLSPKTSIFNLMALGGEPNYTQAYLEATMEEFINLKRELLANASAATQFSMRGELGQIVAELRKSKQAMLDYQSQNSVVFLQPNGGNNAADYLSSLARRLAEHKSELQLLKTLSLDANLERQAGIFTQPGSSLDASPSTTFEEAGAAQSPDSTLQPKNSAAEQHSAPAAVPVDKEASPSNMPSTLGGFETAYLQAKQQVLLLKARLNELSKVLSPTASAMVALNGELALQETLLGIFLEQSREQLKNRQHTLQLQIQDLEAQIAEWNIKAVDVSKKLSDFEALRENQKRLQTSYDQVQATLRALDVDKGIRQESITIFEPATPAMPTPPKLGKHLAMSGLVGLVIGTGILLLLNHLDDRPSSFTELEQLFQEPVLGQIPLVKTKNKKAGVPVLQMDDDRHAMVEAYNNLRSALIFKESLASHPKSIVITSALPNDGKSMVCASLAITFAQSGARVLLVDADLRRGVMHKHFSVANGPGLAEVLAGQCEWSKAVTQTSIPNLDLLPCGASPRRPASLFVAQTSRLLKEVAGHYDYYLFDTAPVMVADDVSSLAPHVGSLIMVIRAGSTSGRIAQAALDQLYLRKINVLGLVFNAVPPNTSEYYYYRYKEYYTQDPNT